MSNNLIQVADAGASNGMLKACSCCGAVALSAKGTGLDLHRRGTHATDELGTPASVGASSHLTARCRRDDGSSWPA